MSHLDLSVTEARRTMVKRMLTPRMRNRLEDEEAKYNKIRKRDRSNALLTNNIDSLVNEEGESTYNLKQVRKLNNTV